MPGSGALLRDAKFPYAVGYGLTETSPLIAGCSPDVTKYRATGTILPGLDVKIINPDDKGEGEIVVKGDSVMKGYYKDAAQTREVFTPDGYFLTGDLGIIRKNYLFIRGRLKNVIIGPSGENIYPEEIETAINESENVLESLVFSREKRIIARIYLNYEFFDQEQKKHHYNSTQMQDKINKALDDIKRMSTSGFPPSPAFLLLLNRLSPLKRHPHRKSNVICTPNNVLGVSMRNTLLTILALFAFSIQALEPHFMDQPAISLMASPSVFVIFPISGRYPSKGRCTASYPG